jgi:MSHA biogenesis protein MshQ
MTQKIKRAIALLFQLLLTLVLLGTVSPVFATTYSLPGALGSGIFSSCSSSTYICSSNIDFGNDNNAVLNLTLPMTLRLTNGNFKAKNNLTINSNGHAFAIQLDNGNFQVENNFTGSLNIVTNNGNVEFKNNGNMTGNITASGNIVLENNTTVNGICNKSWNGSGTCGSSCVVDNFASGSLNPALWNTAAVSGSFVPGVVDVGGQKRIRLTQASGNQATMLQLKKWFPGAGNKIVVDFDYYVYGGNGADGVTVVFSDAAFTPAPGGFGGSLGYAQRSGVINGFAGGWLAVGLDEFGNFTNSSEGRSGYPSGWTPPVGAAVAAGVRKNNVSVRGSGSGSTGYALLANAGTVSPVLWASTNTASSLNKFRITIDHSDNTHAYVSVARDATGTGSYVTVVPTFDAKSAPGQAAVPANWLVSFTGSTGGSHNFHEIANLSICATTVTDPDGGTVAANFECMDGSLAEANYINRQSNPSGLNPIYTKLARTGFPLRVVPIKTDGSVELAAPFTDTQVEVFDVSTGVEPACSALASGSRIGGPAAINFLRVSDLITVNKAVTKARCRVTYTDPVTSNLVQGCGSDLFAVRPGAVTLTPTVATAGGPSATATPAVKAGANFSLRATTSTSSSDAYSGTLTQNAGAITAQNIANDTTKANGGVVGTLTPASLVANAAAVTANYSEVGYLYLAAGAYRDTTFTAVDGTTDCLSGNTSVTLSGGKYGCVIGNTAEVKLGRFIPDHFEVTLGTVTPACGSFSYFGQDGFSTNNFNLIAKNASGGTTSNYQKSFARLGTWQPSTDTTAWTWGNLGFTSTLPTGATLSASADPTPVTGGNWLNGEVTLTAKHQVSRPDALTIETPVTVNAAPSDADSVTTLTPQVVAPATPLRFGRLRIANANGSELLALPVPLTAQYWNGQGFVTNTLDNCASLAVPTLTYFAQNTNNQLASGETSATLNNPFVTGIGSLELSAPGNGNYGYLDVTVTAPAWLQYNWDGIDQGGDSNLFDDNPRSRAAFGKRKGSDKVIIRREIY